MIGKSIFIWSISEIFGGDVTEIATELKTAGFQSVILHETNVFNWRSSKRIALVEALKKVGIEPYGGAAVYGTNPAVEGQRAAAICKDYKLPGFVFDAEAAFDKASSPDSAAANLLRAFRKDAPEGTKAGWCWWAFFKSPTTGSTYHPKSILWAAMEKGYGDADFGVPMMYWSWGDDASAAVKYLEASFAQWRTITDKPIVPAGRAYIGDGGSPTDVALIAFEKRARELGADGVTWWSMQHALNVKVLPGIWKTLSGLKPFGDVSIPETPVEDPVVLTLEQKVELLWEKHPELHPTEA